MDNDQSKSKTRELTNGVFNIGAIPAKNIRAGETKSRRYFNKNFKDDDIKQGKIQFL